MKKFVVFMGLDGTGKTLQSAALKRYLLSVGKKPVVIHHGSPIFSPAKTIKTFLRTPLIKHFKKFGVHKDYDEKISETSGETIKKGKVFGKMIGYYIVLFGFMKSWFHYVLYKRHILIYDRCFLDDIVKAEWRFGGGGLLGAFLLSIVPRPNVCIVFRIPIEISFKRKKALNCTFEEYRMKEYYFDESLRLAKKAGWTIRELQIGRFSAAEVSTLVEEVFQG